ncbi:arylamine N-acetyltransferase family protein [Cryptosporangium minutisporangium]|uniref:Arylamine N-acetyltransferase n=1 Tax=Cryptosporangium minutisporangium TaxID=113569 RepID=A0ABP6T9A5_9ACTN
MIDVDAYLTRIGAHRGDSLAELHAAHVLSVPFEDYDIHLGIPIDLDLDAIAAKVVGRRRGGFCYELNGLFAALLSALGHRVTLVSAFSLDPDRTPGPDFEHARLLVDDAWIADVGNGAGWLHPVPLALGVSAQSGGEVEICRDGDLWWSNERRPGRDAETGWAWRPTPRRLAEFLPRCRYQESDPASPFVARRLAVLSVPGGRISLVNGVFSETGQPDRTVDEAEERRLLAERFGIELPDLPWTNRSAA